MSVPALIFGFVALVAVATLIVRRRTYLPFVIGGVAAAIIGVFILFAPLDTAVAPLGMSLRLDSTWQVLGRPLNFDPQDRAAVGYLFLVGALFFGFGWVVRPGRSFVPVGFLALGLLTGALTVEPFLFAAIFLELAAMACVLILVPPASINERGVLNLLIMYTMAMMAILFTGWLLENVGVTSVTPELALRVILLLGLGFLILLFVPPFHYWLPNVSNGVNPYALALVAIILQISGFFILLRFLDTYSWMREDVLVGAAIQAAGMFMIGFGGLVIVTQTSFLKLMVYAFLADIGVSLLAISSNLTIGTEVALGLTSVRVVSLGLWGLGASLMASKGFTPGSGHQAPLATAAALAGLMSLAGLPLTAGFPWRWSVIAQIPEVPFAGVVLMVGSTLAILWVVVRWAISLFDRATIEEQAGESSQRRLVLALAGAICLLLGVFPQLTLPWVLQASAGLASIAP